MYEDPNICEACLSKDRQLIIINRIRPLIVYLDIKELAKSQGCICWECYTTIVKFNKFRSIARDVQEILAKGSTHKESFSHLGINIIKYYDYNFQYIEPSVQENDNTEPILVKQEQGNDSDNDETVFVDVIECKQEKKLPNKRLASKRLATKRSLKEKSKDTKIDLPEDFMLTKERLTTKRLSKDKSKDTKNDLPEEFMLTKERLPTKRLSKDRSKDMKNDLLEKFQTVMVTEEILPAKRLSKDISNKSEGLLTKRLPSKRLSTPKSKDIQEDTFDNVLTERTESKSLPAKRLTRKRLSAKRLEDPPELSEKFEMVTLTDEEVTKSREEKRNHHNYKKLPFKCDFCVLGFTKKDNYDYHMSTKHNECKGSPCDVCSVRFTNLILLHNHRNLHYQHFRCKLCEYKGNTHMAIVNHVTEKHKDDTAHRIHCKLCTQCFTNREEISTHMRTEHTLYCNECGEKFKTKGSLRLHLKRLHTIKREFICPDCKKTFLTRSRLETHMTRHSTTLAKRLAYCTICRVQYKDLAIYRSHLRNSVNHVQEKFPCPDCDKKFASKAYWKKHHNFYHLKKSQHKCDECDKIFISYFLLKGHRQKYHGLSRPRNHLCDICQKSFYNVTNLRAHMQIHSSHRAYMCARCGDTFKQRPALYTHQRLVHSDNKWTQTYTRRSRSSDGFPQADADDVTNPALRPYKR